MQMPHQAASTAVANGLVGLFFVFIVNALGHTM